MSKIIAGLPAKEYFRQNYLKKREQKLQKSREYKARNLEKCKEATRAWTQKNKDRKRATDLAWRLANKDRKKATRKAEYWANRDVNLAKSLDWQKKNPGKAKARGMKRLADQIKRTPKWANLNKIREIYELCPSGYHVDHIIPLRGSNVSGLHVEWNLQYLTPSENCSKGNKFDLLTVVDKSTDQQ